MITKEEFNNLRRNPPILIDFLEENGKYVAAIFLKINSPWHAISILFPTRQSDQYLKALRKVGEWIVCCEYDLTKLDLVLRTSGKAAEKNDDYEYVYAQYVRSKSYIIVRHTFNPMYNGLKRIIPPVNI